MLLRSGYDLSKDQYFLWLPLEILELIAKFLHVTDAKSIACCSWQLYNGMQRRIWWFPRFRQYLFRPFQTKDDLRQWIPRLENKPVKILQENDFHYIPSHLFNTVGYECLNEVKSLRILNVSRYMSNPSALKLYLKCNFKVRISSLSFQFFTRKPYYSPPENELRSASLDQSTEILRHHQNLNVLFYHEQRDFNWKVDDFEKFHGVNIEVLAWKNIIYVNIIEKRKYLSLLNTMKIRNIWLIGPNHQFLSEELLLTHNDLSKIQHLNITAIDSVFLIKSQFPWPVFSTLTKLQRIYLHSNDRISYKRMCLLPIYKVMYSLSNYKGEYTKFGYTNEILDHLIHDGYLRRVNYNKDILRVRGFLSFVVKPKEFKFWNQTRI